MENLISLPFSSTQKIKFHTQNVRVAVLFSVLFATVRMEHCIVLRANIFSNISHSLFIAYIIDWHKVFVHPQVANDTYLFGRTVQLHSINNGNNLHTDKCSIKTVLLWWLVRFSTYLTFCSIHFTIYYSHNTWHRILRVCNRWPMCVSRFDKRNM